MREREREKQTYDIYRSLLDIYLEFVKRFALYKRDLYTITENNIQYTLYVSLLDIILLTWNEFYSTL